MEPTDEAADPERILREQFGLQAFRTGQREVIDAVLDDRDVLCVMPTGGGKSLCYQLPALLKAGLTLVVSPLIALMKDQVDALQARGLRATLINSTLGLDEQRARLIEAEAGHYDLLYVAPERFRSGHFVERMARLRPALLAIDEAHCISEWGHDFRPDYARLGLARRKLGMPPCIALTATATDLVRRDIAEQLDLRDPSQFVTGFDRPNLSYAVVEARRDAEKFARLAELLRATSGSVVIYASSRKRCEAIAEFVSEELRRSVVAYHAGMERDLRHDSQESFMRGKVDVIVATNAFGMGVDKPDIRAVVHFNLPGTLEAYYQEAGRAGRDGLPAHCLLLYAPGDRKLQQLFIENEYPPRDLIDQVYEYLRRLDADPIELTQSEIREAVGTELNESAVGAALKILEGAGAIERFHPRENMAIVRVDRETDDPPLADRVSTQAHVQKLVMIGLEGLCERRLGEAVYFHPEEFAKAIGIDRAALLRAIKQLTAELPVTYVPPFRGNAVRVSDRSTPFRDLAIDFASLGQRRDREYEKLERMIRYAESRHCRRAVILGYFGEPHAEDCGRCDRCRGSATEQEMPPLAIDTSAALEVVLKALSGVARAKGKFGKTTVAQMLTGSTSEKMDRWNLTRLSTFGVLGDFTQAEVSQMLDALCWADLVTSEDVDRFRPVVNLSEAGWAFLKGRGTTETDGPLLLTGLPHDLVFKIRQGGLQRVTGGAAATASAPFEDDDPSAIAPPSRPSEDENLLQRLRVLRTAWAREAGLSPGYVLSNETLELLVLNRPGSPQALGAIKGIGKSKLERFGSELLEAIAGTSEPVTDAEPPDPDPPDAAVFVPPDDAAEDAEVSEAEWTCRLLDRGFNAAEAASIRRLDAETIVRHALHAANAGRPVPLDAFLDPEQIASWDADPPASPPDDRSPLLWSLYRAVRGVRPAPGPRPTTPQEIGEPS